MSSLSKNPRRSKKIAIPAPPPMKYEILEETNSEPLKVVAQNDRFLLLLAAPDENFGHRTCEAWLLACFKDSADAAQAAASIQTCAELKAGVAALEEAIVIVSDPDIGLGDCGAVFIMGEETALPDIIFKRINAIPRSSFDMAPLGVCPTDLSDETVKLLSATIPGTVRPTPRRSRSQ